METHNNFLINKALKENAKLEAKLNKIISDFKRKTNTMVVLKVENNEFKIILLVDIDKSTL